MSSHRMKRVAQMAATALVATAGLAALAPSSQAAPGDGAGTIPTMIILDASGSMLADDAPGPRIDAAKSAIHTMVSDLPANADVGLMAYGTGTGNSGAEKDAGCQDVKTLVPVGPIDSKQFLATVDAISASGYTPIGAALRQAASALPAEGPRSIVLVSDGIDTCSPPSPCDVAKELAAGGTDLTVHTVGFKVDEQARKDLECIAQATTGTYTDAADARQLDVALKQKVDYAISGYDVVGKPVEGATDRNAANIPLIAPGQWIDQFPAIPSDATEQRRYYRIDPEPGWTPHIAATVVGPSEVRESASGTVKLNLKASTPSGSQCGSDNGYGTASNSYKPVVASLEPTCEGETIVEVIREDDLFHTMPLDLELVVRFEPPSDISRVPDAEIRDIPASPTRGPNATGIEGGTSFNTAVELKPGQTYASSIKGDEARYFKVPLEWGQQMSYSFVPTGRSGLKDRALTVKVDVFDPMRNDKSSASSSESWYGTGGKNDPITGGTDEPVRATSYNLDLNGYYYLLVNSTSYGDDAVTQNFEFTVATSGEIEEGPIYLSAPGGPPLTTTAPESSAGSGDPNSGDRTAGNSANRAGDATDSDAGGFPWLSAGIGGGVLLLVIACVVIVGWRRRRGRNREQGTGYQSFSTGPGAGNAGPYPGQGYGGSPL